MSRCAKVLPFAALCAASLFALTACDSEGETDGPTTSCDFNFNNPNTSLGDFGEACTAGTQCAYGVCILPGSAGNIINSQFGYCSRGCNCDNATASALSAEEKASYTCLDPSGFQGKKRQVVPICGGVADCTAIDAGWTTCEYPDTGAAVKVCHAL